MRGHICRPDLNNGLVAADREHRSTIIIVRLTVPGCYGGGGGAGVVCSILGVYTHGCWRSGDGEAVCVNEGDDGLNEKRSLDGAKVTIIMCSHTCAHLQVCNRYTYTHVYRMRNEVVARELREGWAQREEGGEQSDDAAQQTTRTGSGFDHKLVQIE